MAIGLPMQMNIYWMKQMKIRKRKKGKKKLTCGVSPYAYYI